MQVGAIRVVIADDHPVVREGMRVALEQEPAVRLVGVAPTFGEAIAAVETQSPDVLVLDLQGMQGSPLSTVEGLHRSHPGVGIVIFSSTVDLAPELLQAGALGYVAKEELSQQLLHAIRAAARGQRFLSPVVAEYMERSSDVRQAHHLTPRELEVLKLLAQGLSTIEIGQQAGIDPRSVQNYITTLRRKTGCEERTQLADWYRRLTGFGDD
jgi:DNA-binding NarL/FixJ family response regulator